MRKTDLTRILENTDELVLEMQHDSDLFPEGSDEVITCTAGGVANTFSDWVEIAVDGVGTTFSSVFDPRGGHISGLLIEDLSVKDKRYVLEVARTPPGGTEKIKIITHRFLAGNVKFLAAVQSIRVRATQIPCDCTISYRMKCETAGATCEVSFRYHYH